MPYLFNFVYLALLVALSPWLAWQAWRTGKYRDGWSAKLLGRVRRREGKRRCIWLHAVSVGEVNLLEPILARFEQAHPDWDCVISTTTKTGFELAHKRYAPRQVFYCPLDFSWAVDRALRRVRPDLLVLAELELWPNLLHFAKRRDVRIAVVNGRLGEKSWRGYARIKWLARRMLGKLDLIAVQNDAYAARFLDLGAKPEAVQVTGSVKFDNAHTDRDNPATRRLRELIELGPDERVFLAGSTQDPEESLALAAFEQAAQEDPKLRLILVPRHPERFDEVAALLDARKVRFQRRSLIKRDWLDTKARVLLVDVVGELGAWWGLADIGFVGGSLTSRGGQNMIEPAGYGVATCFGPNTWNFRDVVSQLTAAQAAEVVASGEELTAFVLRCLREPDFAADLGRRSRELVLAQLGAADRTLTHLNKLVAMPFSSKDLQGPYRAVRQSAAATRWK
jgi:3-deoxy-D-manno-octulosonic-acid transferase